MKILDIPQSGRRGLNVSQAGPFGQISPHLAATPFWVASGPTPAYKPHKTFRLVSRAPMAADGRPYAKF